MNLSKVYDCLPNDAIIAKFEAYGFDNIILKLFHSYFLNRKQRLNIGSAISAWIDILTGATEGSFLGSLIFSVFINDLIMFVEKSDIYNFADDNTLCKSSPRLTVVLNCWEHGIAIVLNWFKVNSSKGNLKKFQLMVLGGRKSFQCKCKIEGTYIFSKDKVVLLGKTINNKLKFEAYTENLCKKASYRLSVLQRIKNLDFDRFWKIRSFWFKVN